MCSVRSWALQNWQKVWVWQWWVPQVCPEHTGCAIVTMCVSSQTWPWLLSHCDMLPYSLCSGHLPLSSPSLPSVSSSLPSIYSFHFLHWIGWPSFSDVTAKGSVAKVVDESYGMIRIEAVCTKVRGIPFSEWLAVYCTVLAQNICHLYLAFSEKMATLDCLLNSFYLGASAFDKL